MDNPRKRGGGGGSSAAGTTPRSKPATTATAREVESEWAGLTLEQFRAEVPRDPDDARFIFSFPAPASPSSALHTPQEAEEAEALVAFFDKFGFVVVRDVLTPQEAQATVNEIFGLLEEGTEGRFDRHDVSTWDQWPAEGMAKHGMPSRPPLFTPQILRNRQNPRLVSPFALLFGSEDIMISHDRASLFRPTKGVQFPTGARDMPHWRTSENLHLDMDVWGYLGSGDKERRTLAGLQYGDRHLNHFIFENNQVCERIHPLNVQAVLNLVDNVEADGGFQCVPGFRHHFNRWAEANAGKRDLVEMAKERNSMMFPDDDPIQKFGMRITMRAGSMVIWDQRTPHGARPNKSGRMRCAQFLRMFPAQPMDPKRAQARVHTVDAKVRAAGFAPELTDLGRRVFGLSAAAAGGGGRTGGDGGGGRRGSPARVAVPRPGGGARGGGGWQRGGGRAG